MTMSSLCEDYALLISDVSLNLCIKCLKQDLWKNLSLLAPGKLKPISDIPMIPQTLNINN